VPDYEGKVALITGAARGQGRSHAVRMAELGADVVAVDVCADLPFVPYALPGPADLEETARAVEKAGRRCLAIVADVRDAAAMAAGVERALEELGQIDVVCANAGVIQLKPAIAISAADWASVIAVNLTGVWHTIAPVLPSMIEREQGAIVIISSAAGLKGPPHMAHYAASKSGVIGLMRSLAAELGPVGIRVNCVAPTTVDTTMIHFPQAYQVFRPDLPAPGRDDVLDVFASLNVLPVPWIEPADVTEAVIWLASDEARYVTGIVLPVDAGTLVK
jgi:SDR family mycofactocin-dependent oxidoreductase